MTNRAAVLGAGPVGLDAALALRDAGWTVRVHEAGDEVGASVRSWGHVRLFTPWSMNLSTRMRAHLPAVADLVDADPEACPTGHELVDRLLVPLAGVLHGAVRTGSAVLGVSRRGQRKPDALGNRRGPFRLLIADGDGRRSGAELDPGHRERSEDADLVVDATGTYGRAALLGDGGGPAPGERAARVTRHLPDVAGDPGRWAGRRVLLVGAGKSAQTAARDLAGVAGELDWVVRDPDPDWGAIPDDTLPARQELVEHARRLAAGAIGGVRVRTGTHVEALRGVGEQVAVVLRGPGGDTEVVVDEVVALCGYVADPALHGELQVHECYASGAPMALAATLLAAAGEAGDGPVDCLAQPAVGVDVLRSPEPDFFILGAKSYGRANSFLLRTGYEQVDEIARAYTLVGR